MNRIASSNTFLTRSRALQVPRKAGRQFVAITDPGSKMQKVAEADGFRQIFFGDPEIGGRFSALSAFGLAAAASMGLDVELLLDRASEMATACRTEDPAENPGALLGTILGVCQKNGRDKLTIIASPEIDDLALGLNSLSPNRPERTAWR